MIVGIFSDALDCEISYSSLETIALRDALPFRAWTREAKAGASSPPPEQAGRTLSALRLPLIAEGIGTANEGQSNRPMRRWSCSFAPLDVLAERRFENPPRDPQFRQLLSIGAMAVLHRSWAVVDAGDIDEPRLARPVYQWPDALHLRLSIQEPGKKNEACPFFVRQVDQSLRRNIR